MRKTLPLLYHQTHDLKQIMMTTRRFTAFLIFLLTFVWSGQALQAQGWKNEYLDVTVITQAAQTPDGGYLACGVDNDKRLVILKTDADGVLLYKKVVPEVGKLNSAFLTEDKDGNFYIATTTDTTSSPTILKISPKTDIFWFKSAPIKLSITDFKLFSDSNLGIAGLDDSKTPKFIKLNAQADTLWTRTYSNPNGYIPDFAEDVNGEIFWKINDLSGRLAKSLIQRLDKNGRLLETITIDSTGKSFKKIHRTNDGNWLLYSDREIRKIKSDGAIIWQKLTTYFNLERYIDRVIPTNDGGYIALGLYGAASPPYRHEFIKLNAQGDSLWYRPTNQALGVSFYMFSQMQQTADNGILLSGNIERTDGTIRINAGYLIKASIDGITYANRIVGKIIHDSNSDCKINNAEKGIKGWFVKAENINGKVFYGTSDSTGAYTLEVDSGRYKVNILLPNNLWQACRIDTFITTRLFLEADTINFPVKTKTVCANLTVNIGTPLLKRCTDNIYTVSYCNQGTSPVENAYVEVTLDTNLIYQRASLPIAVQTGRKYRFNIGNLDVFQCDSFYIITKLRCDTPSVVERTICTKAHIFPDSICPAWKGANIEVSGSCQQDSVSLLVRNTGTGATSTQITNVVIVDEVVFMRLPQNFNTGQQRTYNFKAEGKTFRIESDQERGHPSNQSPSFTIEGCGRNAQGGISTGYIMQLPEPDGDPYIDIDCQQVMDVNEPNVNLPSPVGYRQEHFIDANTDIDYTIHFQNTGKTAVNTLIIRDTLSEFLESSSVIFGASSHLYKGEMIGQNTVKITFNNNFNLPDSTLKPLESKGYVKFRVKQKPNLPNGTKIHNKAALYFDTNNPIFTNRSFHTVGKGFLIVATVDNPLQNAVAVKVFPNPFSDAANFELNIDPLSKNSRFQLFDLTGRLVRTQNFDGKDFTFERQNLKTGLYFFMIENNGRRLASGKISVSEN
jgi:uncharacterized repeat protein (TIGR01451 family)